MFNLSLINYKGPDQPLQARQQIAKLITPQYGIRYFSNWADQMKSDPHYASWTPVLHYVSVNYLRRQNPDFDEKLDCPFGKCVVRAIATYTSQSNCRVPITEQRRVQRREAFLFLIHFIGETTQPLHVCGRDGGGKHTKVIFDGKLDTLHNVWDNLIVHKRVEIGFKYNIRNEQKNFRDQIRDYVTYLSNEIMNGQYKNVAHSWLSKEEATATTRFGNSLAAIDYVKDTVGARRSTCKAIWLPYDEMRTQDFGAKYFSDNMHFVDLQLAKAGYRLAHHLNQIFKNCLQK